LTRSSLVALLPKSVHAHSKHRVGQLDKRDDWLLDSDSENHSQFQKGGHAMLRKPTVVKAVLLALGTSAALALAAAASLADDAAIAQLRFERGNFAPVQLTVQANKPFKVKVTNGSESAIEFESFELHRGRVVPPGETITVHMPSLAPGNYQFFDDFHHEVPKGLIVSK
jgi:hypothetical protein